MSATSYGWLVLAFPLAGTLVVSLGWRVLPGRLAGWIASGAILGAFLSAIGALVNLQDHPATTARWWDSAGRIASTGDFQRRPGILIDPLSVFMCLGSAGCRS